MKMIGDGHNYKAHERASAALEMEFGHEHVPGKHSKRDRTKQPEPPKETFTTAEQQQAARTELTPSERKEQVTALRAGTDSGQAFKNALAEAGYILAQGDKRAMVLVDAEGEVYSLSRHVTDLKAKELKAFMADVDNKTLPTVEQAKVLHQQAPTPKPVEAPAQAQKQGVEASKFLMPQTAEKPAEPPQASKAAETAALEKAIADRQAVELQKWQAYHAKETAQTAYVLDREVAEKMKNYDAVQQAAVTRLEREHKRQADDIWERIQRKVNPAGAAEKAQARRLEAEALQRRLVQERKDYLALQIQSKQIDLDGLKERHDQKLRDVTGNFPAERERYLKDQATAKRLLTELQEQRRQEEDRQRRDGPHESGYGPPGRVR